MEIDNGFHRAQALWLLAKLPKGNTYLDEGLRMPIQI